MASTNSPFLFVFLLLSLSLPAKSDSDFINKTCKTTPYYALCVSWLRSDPTSAHADTKGLAAIMLSAAAANATSASSYLASQLPSGDASSGGAAASGPSAAAQQKALRLCADKYSSASDSLQTAMQEVAAEMYDYAAVDAGAAGAYADACRNAFRRAPAAAYPKELANREVNLKRMCAVAVGILNLLISQPST